jgi:RNA polymerase sigma-70 factor (ECF subfamily)
VTLQPQTAQGAVPEDSDAALMTAIAAGDARAFDRLVRRHLKRAYNVAYGMVYNSADAQDVAQDAMMRVWMYAPTWRAGESAVTTWLHRIVVNCCYDFLRKKARQPQGGEVSADIEDMTAKTEQDYAETEQKKRLRAMLRSLPERQRMAVTLCYLEEMSNADAAAVMGVHIKALEGLLVRARKALKPMLATLADKD